MMERMQIPLAEGEEGAEPGSVLDNENTIDASAAETRGRFLTGDFTAERPSSAELRKAVDDARQLLEGYYGFVGAAAGVLSFVREIPDTEGLSSRRDLNDHLETLEQGTGGYRESLREATDRLKGFFPGSAERMPAQVASLLHTLERCLVELEGAQIPSLTQKSKVEIVSALENLVHAARGEMGLREAQAA